MDDTTQNGRHKSTERVRELVERMRAEPGFQQLEEAEFELDRALTRACRMWSIAALVTGAPS